MHSYTKLSTIQKISPHSVKLIKDICTRWKLRERRVGGALLPQTLHTRITASPEGASIASEKIDMAQCR